ncbi:MAG: FliO/MopB family protein [Deltaproteobacteria bacterium]|nr:FliO/MopB family protein [Deltaproteobacteria bacterium]
MTVKTPFFLFLSVLVSFFVTPGAANANAAAKLTNVTVERVGERAGLGTAIDLSFDRPVSARGLKAEYERNFMQLVFRGTKIDGAKIVPAAGGAAASDSGRFQKVFAYAYSPDVARVRFIFGAQRAPRGKISFWNKNARTIRVLVRETGKNVEAMKPPAKADEKSPEEKELIKEVVSSTREIDIHNPDSIKAAFSSSGVDKTKAEDSAPQGTKLQESEAIGVRPDETKNAAVGVKAEPSKYFVRMALSLLGMIGIFLGGVFLVRRYSSNIKKLPFGKKERIIQVIATHYLGNKKNISLVKVAGDYLVVGVGNEGISLISRLGNEANVDKYLEDRFWGGTFEKHLNVFAKPAKSSGANDDGARDVAAQKEPEPDTGLGTAAQAVTDRVELSSIRANIREKLTKLKPLA